MTLVDTSVWIDHLRAGNEILGALLEGRQVLGHAFVTGELALGNLRGRNAILRALQRLPQATVAPDEEVLHFIDRQAIFGRGIGFFDAHLLAAARLTAGTELWTHDRRLRAVAAQLGLAAALSH